MLMFKSNVYFKSLVSGYVSKAIMNQESYIRSGAGKSSITFLGAALNHDGNDIGFDSIRIYVKTPVVEFISGELHEDIEDSKDGFEKLNKAALSGVVDKDKMSKLISKALDNSVIVDRFLVIEL